MKSTKMRIRKLEKNGTHNSNGESGAAFGKQVLHRDAGKLFLADDVAGFRRRQDFWRDLVDDLARAFRIKTPGQEERHQLGKGEDQHNDEKQRNDRADQK